MEKCLEWAKIAAVAVFCATASVTGLLAAGAYADSLESSHYQFIETDLGGGGLIPSSSNNYQTVQSVGDAAVGNTQSTNFQTEGGSQTTADPSLAFAVNNSGTNFGSFSPSSTATATSTFSVSNYTSYGYIVQVMGDTPHNGNHVIPAIVTSPTNPTASPQPGTEQFGINLVANTSPASFGANPDQGQFGKGVAATNYDQPNKFRYISGDTIATSPKSSGVTTFTISYIVNVGSLTPGGQYVTNQSLICTATY